jgi:hypothetical protein
VLSVHAIAAHVRIRPGPTRSPDTPHGTRNSAEPSTQALTTRPLWILTRFSSAIMNGDATEMFIRNTYAIRLKPLRRRTILRREVVGTRA